VLVAWLLPLPNTAVKARSVWALQGLDAACQGLHSLAFGDEVLFLHRIQVLLHRASALIIGVQDAPCWRCHRQTPHLQGTDWRHYDASVDKEGGSVKRKPRTPAPKDETPFQRFERLARRIVSVPKDEAQQRKQEKPEPQS
jgi:hypothetical protein